MRVRVALIGVGHWHTPMYLTALQEMGAYVVAVSDPDPVAMRRVAGAMQCRGYEDYRALLEMERPDFCLAMPRHAEAAAVAADLLDTGLPFAIEKPLGLNADEVRPLAARARKQGAYTAVPLINRYRPIWELLTSGTTRPDDIRHAHFRIINGPADRYARAGCGWMLDPALSGGGALRNLGIHGADAALALVGGRPENVEVIGASLGFAESSTAIEHYAAATLAGPNGLSVLIEAGYTYPLLAAGMTRGGDSEWRIATRDAYLVERDDGLFVARADGEQMLPGASSTSFYHRFLTEAIDNYRGGRPPIADIEDCYRAATLVDTIYRRAGESGQNWPKGDAQL